jgi:ribonuclease Z
MSRLIILGSAAARADREHDNAHMVLQGDNGSAVLIDCGSNPAVRLQRAGIHFEQLTDLVLTHFHPDHVHGVPILLMHMWLSKRQLPLRVYGLPHCLRRTEDMMAYFTWDEWPNRFPVTFHCVPEREGVLVLDSPDFRITSSPTSHFNVPTIGLRVEVKSSGLVLAYSCDTEPVDSVVRLSQGADILIHEAAGDVPGGHSSAAQAGQIATRAGARRLVLIHYQVWGDADPGALIGEAQTTFDGPVELAQDFLEFDLSEDPLPAEYPLGRLLF